MSALSDTDLALLISILTEYKRLWDAINSDLEPNEQDILDRLKAEQVRRGSEKRQK